MVEPQPMSRRTKRGFWTSHFSIPICIGVLDIRAIPTSPWTNAHKVRSFIGCYSLRDGVCAMPAGKQPVSGLVRHVADAALFAGAPLPQGRPERPSSGKCLYSTNANRKSITFVFVGPVFIRPLHFSKK